MVLTDNRDPLVISFCASKSSASEYYIGSSLMIKKSIM